VVYSESMSVGFRVREMRVRGRRQEREEVKREAERGRGMAPPPFVR
jgi:hypothetical protein